MPLKKKKHIIYALASEARHIKTPKTTKARSVPRFAGRKGRKQDRRLKIHNNVAAFNIVAIEGHNAISIILIIIIVRKGIPILLQPSQNAKVPSRMHI